MADQSPTAAPSPADRAAGGPPWGRPAAVGAVGTALLAVSWLLLDGRHTVPGWEADVFDAANGLPDGLGVVLEPIMQLGTFPMWVVAGSIAYMVTKRWRPALAAVGAVMLAWLTSRLVKGAVERGRPPELLDDVELREHGVDGHGYASGHATVAFAVATALTAVLPGRWRWVPYPLAVLVAFARVFVGVHLPLDVIGGAGLGTLCGLVALVAFGVVGRPDGPDRDARPAAAADADDQPAVSPGAG